MSCLNAEAFRVAVCCDLEKFVVESEYESEFLKGGWQCYGE